MKHKNFKNKILSAMLHNNPNNYGVSLEAIIENIPFFRQSCNITPKICDELVAEGILSYNIIIHYYDTHVYVYKINSPYIEKIRNVI